MSQRMNTRVEYPEIGVCGLSRARPCITPMDKVNVGDEKANSGFLLDVHLLPVQLIKRELSFAGTVKNRVCEKWVRHREAGKKHDSFKCYQKLEENISTIQKNGVVEFEKSQKKREEMPKVMLQDYNEERSKRYYCIAATVLEIYELEKASGEANEQSRGVETKTRSKVMHFLLDSVAESRKTF